MSAQELGSTCTTLQQRVAHLERVVADLGGQIAQCHRVAQVSAVTEILILCEFNLRVYVCVCVCVRVSVCVCVCVASVLRLWCCA